MKKYLDYEGLKHLISKIKTSISGKADKNHKHGELGFLINGESFEYLAFQICTPFDYEMEKDQGMGYKTLFFIEEEQ